MTGPAFQQNSQYIEAPLPEIQDASVKTLRLANTLVKRLPPMPSGDLQDLAFTNAKQVEAAQLMDEMRSVYDISRRYDKRNRAVAKARARQQDRKLKNEASQDRVDRRKIQGNTNRAIKRTVKNYARNSLGMGTDLYR
jgi:hypothetical protein